MTLEAIYLLTAPASPCHILRSSISSSSELGTTTMLTVSGENNRLGVQCFPEHDRCVRIVLFHGGISSCEK